MAATPITWIDSEEDGPCEMIATLGGALGEHVGRICRDEHWKGMYPVFVAFYRGKRAGGFALLSNAKRWIATQHRKHA